MKKSRKVISIMAYCGIVICMILAVKFFIIQVVKGQYYQEQVTKQRVKEIVEQPERGKIIDRNNSVLAMSMMAGDIAVYPNYIISDKQRDKVATMLSDTLGVSKNEVMKKLLMKDKKGNLTKWQSIAKRVDWQRVEKIKKANLGGIEITQSPSRYYPNGTLGSSIMGFVNDGNIPGAGLELGMDSYLSGVPGYTLSETDNTGKTIPVGFENISSPVDGQNVKLNIDSYIQYILETRMKQAYNEMQPQGIHGIVMDPNTGEILAMASYPSFDPNNYQKSDPKLWTNSPANFVFEPGSIMKPIYMAMALDKGYINENTSWYDSTGYINVNGTPIHNDNGDVYGKLDLKSIIVNSSNVGMVHISQTMDSKTIADGLKDIGIGVKTGIELPGEETGILATAKQMNNDPLMKATESFGQGIAVTQVQMIAAFSSIINGGNRVTPKLVNQVTDNFGNTIYTENKNNPKEFKENTSELMKSYLNANMHDGTGKDYQLSGYESGGKTGSAWVVDPKTHAYKKGVIIGSFEGFAPLNNPKYAVLITVDQPKGIGFGALSAGPVWHDVMQDILQYEAVPKEIPDDPTRLTKPIDGTKEDSTPPTIPPKNLSEIVVPKLQWYLYDDAKDELKKDITNVPITVKKIGAGEVVVDQKYVFKNNTLEIDLYTKKIKGQDYIYIPYLKEKTKEQIESIFAPYHFNLHFYGNGKVIEQDTPNGTYVKTPKMVFWLK